jgi:hypothetical protein
VFPKKFTVGNEVLLTKRLVIKQDTAEGKGVFAPRVRKLPCEQPGDIWAKKDDIITFYGGPVKRPDASRAFMGRNEGTHYKSIINGQGYVMDGLGWSFEKQVQIMNNSWSVVLLVLYHHHHDMCQSSCVS